MKYQIAEYMRSRRIGTPVRLRVPATIQSANRSAAGKYAELGRYYDIQRSRKILKTRPVLRRVRPVTLNRITTLSERVEQKSISGAGWVTTVPVLSVKQESQPVNAFQFKKWKKKIRSWDAFLLTTTATSDWKYSGSDIRATYCPLTLMFDVTRSSRGILCMSLLLIGWLCRCVTVYRMRK